jgi:glycosyltransferase involved in cell wall biosynthesis
LTTFYGVDASACLRDPRWLGRFEQLFDIGDLFVVLSDGVVDRLAAAGCPEDRIHVHSLGIDFSNIPVTRPAAGTNGRILCVARFVEKKGHALLLEAFRLLRARRPVTLTLIGYGPLLTTIRKTADETGVGPDVSIVDTEGRSDFHEVLRQALQTHHVFALPSVVAADGDDEAGPALSAIYAQASGMPIVLTRFVGSERSLVDGETGLFAEADPGSIADVIERVLSSPELARRIGATGSEFVRREFSLHAQHRVMAERYERLAAQRGRHAAA